MGVKKVIRIICVTLTVSFLIILASVLVSCKEKEPLETVDSEAAKILCEFEVDWSSCEARKFLL